MKEYTCSGIKHAIEQINRETPVKVISFDVFDTLLFRNVENPKDIFAKVGEQAIQKGFLSNDYSGEDYRILRVNAEKRARALEKEKNGSTEISFSQIFDAMPEIIKNPRAMMNLEFDVECAGCYLNPVMMQVLEWAKQSGFQVVCISDMYFSREEITQLFRMAGYSGEIPAIYVSSEWKNTKKSGELFDSVAENMHVLLAEVLHIGDNYNSDYLMPCKKGMKAIHYCLYDGDLFPGLQYEKMMYENNLPTLFSMRRYLPGLQEKLGEDIWYRTGIQIYGPVLTAYTEWIIDVALREGIRCIYPLMREGWLFASLLQREAESRGADIRIEPLFISRKAVFIPSLSEVTLDRLEDIFNASQSTIHSVFKTFGLEEYEGEFLHQFGEEAGKSYYQLADEFYSFIHEERIKEVFQRYRTTKTEEAFGYLCQMGLDRRCMTVDIGFHGTIQAGIEAILREKGIENSNIHLLAFSAKGTIDNVVKHVDIRGYVGSFGQNDEMNTYITWHPRLLEQALMCDYGSTQGYTLQEGSYVPVLGRKDIIPDVQKECIRLLQQGIEHFQAEYQRVRAIRGIGFLKPSPLDTARAYERLVKVPSICEAKAFGMMIHDENFGVDSGYMLCDPQKVTYIRKHGFEQFADNHDITEELWLEGLRTCGEAGYEFRNLCRYAGTNLAKSMALLAQYVVKDIDNENEAVVIIGAGEAGQTLLDFLRIAGIEVEGFIDNNKKLQGEEIKGIRIEAMSYGYQSKRYVLGTLAFADRLLGQAVHTLPQRAILYACRDGAVKKLLNNK